MKRSGKDEPAPDLVAEAERLAPAITARKRGRTGKPKRRQGGKGRPFAKGGQNPVGRRFTKGVSGNPKGRPPDEETFRARAKAMASDLLEEINHRALRGMLTTGQVEAARTIFAEAWGLPPRKIELGGSGGGPLRVNLASVPLDEIKAARALVRRLKSAAAAEAEGGDESE